MAGRTWRDHAARKSPPQPKSTAGINLGITSAKGVIRCQTQSVPEPRFLTLADVAEVLNTSSSQVYALVRSGDLPAIKLGGRGQWRVERTVLEEFITRMYAQTREHISSHPFGREGFDD
jgi:excisionase family DNA binding protein